MNSKPKILFIMHMPPPVHGAAMMGQYIHDSERISRSFECRYINPSASSTVDEVGKMGLKKIWRTIQVFWLIIKTCLMWKPDVVYLTPTSYGRWYSGSLYLNIAYVLAVKLTAKKIVYHMHNKGVASSLEIQPSLRLYYKWLYRNVKVVLLADSLYGEVKEFVDKKDLYICSNGIPETEGLQLAQHGATEVPRLLFLSNLIESKGVIVLLDALKLLKDRGEHFICNFVGGESVDIDVQRFRQEVSERGLTDSVFYLGKKYNHDKEEAYAQSDIFVFPTFYPGECFPLVLLEAMQHRLPCISTTEGGITDIIEDGVNGYVVPREDAEALADRIGVLLNDVERRRMMGQKGFEKYKKYFTLECFETNIEKILRDIYLQ